MAAMHNLSVHCDMANFIAGCRDEATLTLRYDRETGEYIFVKAADPELEAKYKDDREFFVQMRSFIDSFRVGDRNYFRNCGDGRVKVSAWILEMLHLEHRLQPRRYMLGEIKRIHLAQLCAAGYVTWGAGEFGKGAAQMPFVFIRLHSHVFDTAKRQYKELFGYEGEHAFLFFDTTPARAPVME